MLLVLSTIAPKVPEKKSVTESLNTSFKHWPLASQICCPQWVSEPLQSLFPLSKLLSLSFCLELLLPILQDSHQFSLLHSREGIPNPDSDHKYLSCRNMHFSFKKSLIFIISLCDCFYKYWFIIYTRCPRSPLGAGNQVPSSQHTLDSRTPRRKTGVQHKPPVCISRCYTNTNCINSSGTMSNSYQFWEWREPSQNLCSQMPGRLVFKIRA